MPADRDLLDRFNEISAEFAEPDADYDALLAEQADGAGPDRPPRRLDARRDARPGDGRAPRCPTATGTSTSLGRRAAARRAVPTAALTPDLLLLDEPTNHLDAESVAWLERSWPSTGAPSSPSRTTATSSTTSRVDPRAGPRQGAAVPGQLLLVARAEAARLAVEEKTESARRRTLARELEWVRMSPKARHAKPKARLAAYERLLAEEQNEKLDRVEIHIPAGPRLGDVVIQAEGVAKGFGDRLLFEDLSFSLPPGGIVGVIGPNGAGKTTLFRMIAGARSPTRHASVGETVELAYVDQAREDADPGRRSGRRSRAASTRSSSAREVNSRQYVSLVQLPGDRPAEAVGDLSGGERNRVHLAKLLAAAERAPARRADERPRRRHAARARGGAGRLRRLRGRDLARSLVPRPHRDAHPRLRGRLAGDVIEG